MGLFGENSYLVTILFMSILIHMHTSDAAYIKVPTLDQIKNLYSKVCSDVEKTPGKTCEETANLTTTRVIEFTASEAPNMCQSYIDQVPINAKGSPLLKQSQEIMDICKGVVEVSIPVAMITARWKVEKKCTEKVEGALRGNNEKRVFGSRTCLDVPVSFNALCFEGVTAMCNQIEESFPFFVPLDELCTLTLSEKICGKALDSASAAIDDALELKEDGKNQLQLSQETSLSSSTAQATAPPSSTTQASPLSSSTAQSTTPLSSTTQASPLSSSTTQSTTLPPTTTQATTLAPTTTQATTLPPTTTQATTLPSTTTQASPLSSSTTQATPLSNAAQTTLLSSSTTQVTPLSSSTAQAAPLLPLATQANPLPPKMTQATPLPLTTNQATPLSPIETQATSLLPTGTQAVALSASALDPSTNTFLHNLFFNLSMNLQLSMQATVI